MRLMRDAFNVDFTDVIGFFPVCYSQRDCICIIVAVLNMCFMYCSLVLIVCTFIIVNRFFIMGIAHDKSSKAIPAAFVPYNYVGDPDLSVIPPPIDDRCCYRCCYCVNILPHGGNKFCFHFISFQI